MLDLHAHVLPGIDDGPRTLDDAVALAQAMADDGIEHVVLTPHIYPGVFDNTPARIAEAFELLQVAVAERDIPLTMSWAAEVRICPEIIDWLELRRLPLLNGSLVGPGTVLIEMPDGQIPVGTDRLMGMLLEQGITPLIAHPERNKAVMEQLSRLEALRKLGCKFQLTAGSLLGEFGSRAQTTAQGLLDAGWADVVATDAHNRSSRRPRLSAARDWLSEHYGSELATLLTLTNPTAIAGLESFTVAQGLDRLVFRDLPAASAPIELDLNWGSTLQMDQTDFSQSLPKEQLAGTLNADIWSLTDFKIDSVLDDLAQATAHLDGLPTFEQRPAQDDWTLPSFSALKPEPQAAPQPPPAPPLPPAAPAPQPLPPVVPVLSQRVERPPAVATLIAVIAPPVVAAVPAPVEVATALSIAAAQMPDLSLATAPQAPRGMRLSDMQHLSGSSPPQPAPTPLQGPRAAAVMPGGNRPRPAVAPAQPKQLAVIEVVNAVPWAAPSGGNRGFRLSELPPVATTPAGRRGPR
jgi:protein-tyrosine phosphatase